MSSTRTTAAALLKEYYLPGLREVMNQKTFLLSQIERSSESVEGLEIVGAIHIGRNQGVGSRAEGGTLPTAGRQRNINVRSWLKYHYVRLQLSGPLMRSVTSDRGGWQKPLEQETRGAVTDLKADINRQLYGDGTGVLASATGAPTGQVIPVSTLTKEKLRQIKKDMLIDVGPADGTSALTATGLTVSAVSASSITVSSGAASSNGSLIYRNGNRSNEVTGLRKIVAASGSYLGIDPATEPDWVSYVSANGGTPRAVTEELVEAAMVEVSMLTDDEVDLIITTPKIHRNYAALMASLRRFPNPVELKSGYRGLDVSVAGQANLGGQTVGMVYEKDCPSGHLFGLTTNRLSWQRASDWEFMDEDGAMLNRIANQDAYEATVFSYADLHTDSRASHFLVKDLTDE